MGYFKYHAFAVGLAGRIDEPFEEPIPIRASVALPETGGFGSARVEHFRFRDLISAESITAVVAGSYSEKDRTHDALATVIVENLDVLGIVKADRIVSRIAASHPVDGEAPTIVPVGSHFDNLRIAGYQVDLDLATDTFTRLGTAGQVREAYRDGKGEFRQEFDNLAMVGKGVDLPERVQPHFPWNRASAADAIPERNGQIRCGLVREIAGLGPEIDSYGNAIIVPGFGVIRLAEFTIIETERRLTMLQIDLGSTPKGQVSTGGVAGNGSPN